MEPRPKKTQAVPLQEVAPPEASAPVPPKPAPRRPVPIRPPPTRPVTRSQTRRNQGNHANCAQLFDHLCIGKAKANSDPDTHTWEQAMAFPHKMEFLAATDNEINAPVEKGTWKEDHKSNSATKILPSQWVFKIKHTPDRQIKKFKAQICLRGDPQEDSGQSNHSPLASWSTVRLFLTKLHQLQWVTTGIDFSNAFIQSYLP